jgi:hypothetical protein
MPSSSLKQAKLMRAVAHGWQMPGGGGPPKDVAEDFMKADMAKQKATANELRKKSHSGGTPLDTM